MESGEGQAKSSLQAEAELLWSFLDEESDPCAVVSERMELVYVNSAWKKVLPSDWFAKRCHEVFPHAKENCVVSCPTTEAVNASKGVVFTDEAVRLDDGSTYQFGVGVVPLAPHAGDPARGVLLMRRRDELHDEEFRSQLLRDAEGLQERIRKRLG